MSDEEDVLILPVSLNNSRAAAVARQAGIELMNNKLYKQALEQFEKMTKLEVGILPSFIFPLFSYSSLPLCSATMPATTRPAPAP